MVLRISNKCFKIENILKVLFLLLFYVVFYNKKKNAIVQNIKYLKKISKCFLNILRFLE